MTREFYVDYSFEIPGDFSYQDSTTILVISDAHLSGKGTECSENAYEAAKIVNSYAESVEADRIIDLGDTVQGPEAQVFLDELSLPIDIIVGDENKETWKNEDREARKNRYIENVLDPDIEYRVHKEGFRETIDGFETEWVHNPRREERLLRNGFFSTEWDDPRYVQNEPYNSMIDLDIVGWGDKHFDIPRLRGDVFDKGFGSFARNYNTSDQMPKRSINALILGEETVRNIHNDPGSGELVEDVLVNLEEEWMAFLKGGLEAEKRFHRDKIEHQKVAQTSGEQQLKEEVDESQIAEIVQR
ncbi:MAG: hypothetical protein ABEJ83_00190 [Candidatus Nanohaloarchaea archaeon]